ncbi:MAG: hypothetical protein ACQER9_01455 [Nanobdellota archaeon]
MIKQANDKGCKCWRSAGDTDTRKVDKRLICIPGIRPVKIPAKIPIANENIISKNINARIFVFLYDDSRKNRIIFGIYAKFNLLLENMLFTS